MPLRPKMDLREFGALFLRRKWVLVFSLLSVLLAAGVYCAVTPEVYKSSITILIIPQTVPEDYVRSTISLRVEQQLATIRQQVTSRTTLTKMMDDLGLFREERKKMTSEEVFALIRKRVEIDIVRGQGRGSNEAFSLSFQYEDPLLAMKAADRLASVFIDENLKTREQQAVGTSEFLQSQLSGTKTQLEMMEQRVKNYKMRFMGELPQQMDANLRLLTGLQDRLRTNENSTRSLEERQAFIEAQINLLGKSLPVVSTGKGKPGSPVYRESAQSLEIELARKRERLAELSEKYTDKVPEVASAKADVEHLELLVEQARRAASRQATVDATGASMAIAAAPTAAIEEIRQMKARQKAGGVELESLKKEAGEIRKAIAAVERKIEQSPRREQEMISMVRDYENQKQSYDDLLKKKLEADVSQNLEKRQKGTQFLVIDPANLPEEPFRPDRKKVMGGSLLLSLALGFGAVIGLEAMDQRLRDVSDFRHLYKVPVLGSIPALKASPAARPAASGEAPGMVSRLGAVFGNGQAGSPDRHSLFRSTDHIFGEQQKNFCSRVEYAIDSKELKVVAVTSSIAGEGKTVSTVNLANNLAGAGRKKVVLVDLDLRKSDLAKGLRFPSTPGVVERLNGSAKLEEVLRYVSSQGLSVIPSGKRIDDPWELLKGERFRAFLNELKDRFDVVLLDTPPMVPVSDTITLREHVDGFILVFRLGYTPHVLFRQALEDIGEKKLLGVLLNGAQAKSEKYYQRYYGKYYRKQAESRES